MYSAFWHLDGLVCIGMHYMREVLFPYREYFGEGRAMAEPKLPDSTSAPTSLTSRAATESRPGGVGRTGQRGSADRTAATTNTLRIARELMPQDFSISLPDSVRGGTDRMLLHPATDRRQPMR